MAPSTNTNLDKLKSTLDSILGRLYDYRGSIQKPAAGTSQVWAAPPNLPTGSPDPRDYFLHYFQSQNGGPTTNECVTTSVVMSMNIMEDRAVSGSTGPIQYRASLKLEAYTRDLDARGIMGWKYRFSTRSPLPGMMTPWQAIIALRDHAAALKAKYGKSYKVRLSPRCTVNNLIDHLKQGNIVLMHGAWCIKITASSNRHLAFMGGMPHTMLLVGYDPNADQWLLLDPAKHPPASFRAMKTQELITGFWGRKFLFYPPRFSVTIIIPES